MTRPVSFGSSRKVAIYWSKALCSGRLEAPEPPPIARAPRPTEPMVSPVRTTRAQATVEGMTSALREDGYVIVEGMLSPEDVAAKRSDLGRVLAETPTGRNDFEGFSTRRVYAL